MYRIKRFAWLALNALQLIFTLLLSSVGICLALLIRLVSGGARVPLRMAAWFWSPILIYGAGARLKVEGLERVDFSRPHAFVANHQSMIDICALFMALPVPLRFVLKAELARMPFLGWYARAMGMVVVQRGNRAAVRARLTQSAQLLRDGHSLCAFPEGTRSLDGLVKSFKSGIFWAALDAEAAVVPVAISGTGQVMPPGGFHIRPGTITVRIGQPIETRGMSRAERQELAERARLEVLDLLADAPSPPRLHSRAA